ncbi:MAG: 4Fe-4S dicluster domain-containing protein [Tepidisphaeraceae bacterium]|jgi:electron transport complex protein RnfC
MSSAPESTIQHTALWPQQPPALTTIDPPGRLVVPLGGGMEEPHAKPPGTAVRAGEALVRRSDELSHTPVAPISGTLGAVVQVMLSNGKRAWAVELAADKGAAEVSIPPAANGDRGDLVAWIERLRSLGVCANRHCSPDLIGQLNMAVSRPMEMVVCTVLDSDAGLRLNAAVAAHHAQRICAAVALLGRLTRARTAQVCVEAYAGPQWVKSLRTAADAADVRVIDLANDYPQSDPTLMIYSVADRRLRPGALPGSQGVLLLDAVAALAVGEAMLGRPHLSTPAAIHDHVDQRSLLLSVPVGMRLDDLLSAVGIGRQGVILRGGDLLRDIRLSGEAVIAGGELTLHVSPPELPNNPQPCIRCAWCMETCPTRVQPAVVLEAAQRGDHAMAQAAGIHACIDCGLCSHVCPSRLPLLGALRMMRGN